MTADHGGIFKAYDIRGIVPDQLDEATATAIGRSFARLIAAEAPVGDAPPSVLVGHDMRTSSEPLARAFAAGVMDSGLDVVFAGLAATDEVYFGSGIDHLPSAMVTASHNPAEYNGFKLCRPGALAMSSATGLDQIRAEVLGGVPAQPSGPRGALHERDLLAAYARHLHALVPVSGRRLTVVVDAANAMAGHTVPAVFAGLDVELVPLYFELDGTFPHHEANPLVVENLQDLSAAVVAAGADVGLAFDGDADRCFAVDERGQPVSPSVLTCLIAVRELVRHPGAAIIHNLITSRAVPETIREQGGRPVRTPVGHSLIKAEMARSGAVFGGEHSGHYYFRDFWGADSGMLAALHLLAALAETDEPLSRIAAGYDRYRSSGELNTAVRNVDAVVKAVSDEYRGRPDVEIDLLDGLTVLATDWWFNIRPSNTEPLLRLNVEARDDSTLAVVRDSVLSQMRRQM